MYILCIYIYIYVPISLRPPFSHRSAIGKGAVASHPWGMSLGIVIKHYLYAN